MKDPVLISDSEQHVRTVHETFDENDIHLGTEVIYTPRKESSVQFKTDSKGLATPVVKVYHEDPQEALEIAKKLLNEAQEFLDKE